MKGFKKFLENKKVNEGFEGASIEELEEMLKVAIEGEDKPKIEAIKAAIEKAKAGDKSEEKEDEKKVDEDHDYDKQSLEDLEKLLVHHKEDLAEYSDEDKDGARCKEDIKKDIKEIEAAIVAKKSSVDEKIKVNTQAICDEAKKLSPENQAKVFAFVLSLQD